MKNLFDSLKMFLVLTAITGIAYPLLVTGLSQMCFSKQANGSLIYKNNKVIGSELLGQEFNLPEYFVSRPSATTPPYNAAASSGSNLGPLNPKFKENLEQTTESLKKVGIEKPDALLLTSSASGLDPHISPSAARCQAAIVAKARNMPVQTVLDLIEKNTRQRQLGFLGEEVVNVLSLNLDIDQSQSK